LPPHLLILLKAPVPGAVKTRLAATLGAARATAIYRQLVERQLRAIPPDWPVTIHFDPPDAEPAMRAWLTPLRSASISQLPTFIPQPAGDLGTRIHAAFTHAFANGATSALVIGGDCPALDTAILQRAATVLESPDTDTVLGPAADGGYFLLGLKTPTPELFTGLAWSTPAVLDATRARLAAARLTTVELLELADLDDESDWRRAVAAGLLAP